MANKRFKTRLNKKQVRNNILIILAIFVALYVFSLLFLDAISGVDWKDPFTYLMGLGMAFFIPSMTISPFVVAGIALGIQRGKARRVRDDSTFVPTLDLDYYRDNLDGLSPAIVSLLVDLDIYGKKDIAATLLRLQNKGAVDFNDKGKFITLTDNKTELDNGEKELLNLIKTGDLKNKKALLGWMERRFYDAERAGFIKKKKGVSNVPKDKTVWLSILSFLGGFVVWGFFLSLDPSKHFDTVLDVLGVVALLTVSDMLFCLPMYFLVRWSTYNKRFRHITWERTKLGNETAEKIYGLAGFVHDFSLLSEAQKEEVVLWDDYLAYAVVLEENDKIVKDISRFYKIDGHSFDRLHSRHT